MTVVPLVGIEPTTSGLAGRRSLPLSYRGTLDGQRERLSVSFPRLTVGLGRTFCEGERCPSARYASEAHLSTPTNQKQQNSHNPLAKPLLFKPDFGLTAKVPENSRGLFVS